MEREDLIKKLEDIDVPIVEMSGHKSRLKAVLLDSDYFKEQQHFFWFGKPAAFAMSAAFLLLIFLGSEEMFLRVFEQKMALSPGQKTGSSLSYLQAPKITPSRPISATPDNFVPQTTDLPEATTSPATGNKIAGWSAYQNKGFGYEIKLPDNWELGAMRRGDGIGGASDNFYPDEEWAIEPAPVFEVTPESDTNLDWLVKDKNGNTKLKIYIVFKAKFNNIPLEEFANEQVTPKDKIISLVSTKIKLGNNEVIKQDLQISDPMYSGTHYFISDDKLYYLIIPEGETNSELVEQVISTIVFTE